MAASELVHACEAVLLKFGARVEVVVEDICDQLGDLQPYRGMSTYAFDDVRASVRRTVQTFATRLGDGLGLDDPEAGGLSADDVRFYESVGVARARQGVSRAALAKAFTAGYRRSYVELYEIAQGLEALGSDVSAHLAPQLARMYEQARAAMLRGHDAARQDRLVPGDDARARLVADVVEGATDEAELRQRAAELGLGPAGCWWLIVVIAAPEDSARLHRATQAVAGLLGGSVTGAPCQEPVPHATVVAPDRPGGGPIRADGLEAAARDEGVALVTYAADELRTLGGGLPACPSAPGARAHDRRAHPDRCGPPAPALRHPELDPLDEARWVIRHTLGPLVVGRQPSWGPVRTLAAVHDAGGNTKAAARVLGVKDRTVRDRLQKIAGMLGVSRSDVRHGADIDLALCLLWMHRGTLRPPGDPAWSQDHD